MLFSLSLKLNTDNVPENLAIEVINGKFSERKDFFLTCQEEIVYSNLLG